MSVLIIIILIIVILLIIFTLQNSIEISINLFFWEISNAPLVLVLICCIVIGYLLSVIYLYPKLWKLRRENKQLKKYNDKLLIKNDKIQTESENKKIDEEGEELEDLKNNTFFND